MPTPVSPFHVGELEAQRRAGTEGVAAIASGFIRDKMPDQHRAFFAALPCLVIAAGDETGQPWVTIIEGPDRFIRSPEPHRLTVAAMLAPDDPVAPAFVSGMKIGILGIKLETRRRNRLNGVIHQDGDGFAIDVEQSFGNCPQHIHQREWHRAKPAPGPNARVSDCLDAKQKARIAVADTFFIGSGYTADNIASTNGFDASHRGGQPGFVHIGEDGTLHIPDYAGNNFFNTIGNLLRDPRIGLLFVDFPTGDMLQITGRARINWAPNKSHDLSAQRMIEVTVEKVIDRPAALALRWSDENIASRQLKVVDKVDESDLITSFYMADVDGEKLEYFKPGQYLPIELKVPGQPGLVRRSYSLSGSPFNDTYRISVKREAQGIASRFLHDQVEIGDQFAARRPLGDFVIPNGDCPLVLVSAGVGVTPMLPILHAAIAENPNRLVWFIHGTRNGRTEAFRVEVNALVTENLNASHNVFYSAPCHKDLIGRAYDTRGRITAADLLSFNADPDAHYMLCGPASFVADIREGLERGSVASTQIYYETFGPSAL